VKKLLLLLIILPLFSFRYYDDCGVYRWDYKVLVDPTGWPLLNIATKYKTIYRLNRLTRPPVLGNQRTPYEKWKVTVTAWVVMLGKEDDRDYHLVLTNTNRTDSLIAEIPDSSCQKLDHFPALRERYGLARTFVNENVDTPGSSVQELDSPIKVRVTGFLFFDKMAHGHGHAKNGIEIHPITKISLAN
jgi:hypothetical protein